MAADVDNQADDGTSSTKELANRSRYQSSTLLLVEIMKPQRPTPVSGFSRSLSVVLYT